MFPCVLVLYYLWAVFLSCLASYPSSSSYGDECSDLREQPNSIMQATWPEGGPVDTDVLGQAEFIVELSRAMRKGIDATAQPKKAKKGAEQQPGVRANAINVYVASRYLGWQGFVMQKLSEIYQQQGALPQTKELAAALKTIPELSDNATFKKVMPFVSMIQKEMETRGAAALALKSPFDELALVRENIPFLADQCVIEAGNLKVYDAEDESV